MIEETVQVPCDCSDVILAQAEPDILLPAADLKFEANPVGREFLLAPMDLCRVTLDAVRRVEQFATRLTCTRALASRQGSDKHQCGSGQGF